LISRIRYDTADAGGRDPPQLAVLAVARVAGELGADVAHAGGARPEGILGDLADLVRHAGQAQHEKLEAGTMPTAGSA
jgi:hypothetical protein